MRANTLNTSIKCVFMICFYELVRWGENNIKMHFLLIHRVVGRAYSTHTYTHILRFRFPRPDTCVSVSVLEKDRAGEPTERSCVCFPWNALCVRRAHASTNGASVSSRSHFFSSYPALERSSNVWDAVALYRTNTYIIWNTFSFSLSLHSMRNTFKLCGIFAHMS